MDSFNIFLTGVYFTSCIRYAMKYANKSEDGKSQVFMVALVAPGNPYPVTEAPWDEDNDGNQTNFRDDGYYGKAPEGGSQSHYTIGRFFFLTFPIKERE